jgi:vacuolar protein sorting-associated protein 13A/C
MQTEPRPLDQKDVRTMYEEGASQEAILKEMIHQSYDKFILELRDVQGIVATYDEDWRTHLEANIVSTMHILEPTSFKIQAHLCVLDDDPRLPKCRIFGELPSVNVAVTEQRVFEVLKIVTSIPFPENDELHPAPMSKETNIFNSSLSLITKYLDDKQKENRSIVPSETLRPDDTVDEVVQFTDLEVHFVLNACSLTIFKAVCTNTSSTDTFATPTGELAESPLDVEIAQKSVAFDVPDFVANQAKILSFHVRQLEMNVVQRTYDLKVALKLGAVMMDQFRIKNEREKTLNVINTPKYIDNDEFLFTVDYTNVSGRALIPLRAFMNDIFLLILVQEKLTRVRHQV